MNDAQVVMWLIFIMLILVFLFDNRRPPTGAVPVKDYRDLPLWAQMVGELD